MGLNFQPGKFDIEKVRNWKNEVVKKLTGGLGQLVKLHNIDYLQGYAKIRNSNRIEWEGKNDDGGKIKYENLIISTGVKPRTLDVFDGQAMNAEKALDLEDIPEKLLIVGGGYIGLEMATIYSSMGSKVSVVEMMEDFMPGMDTELIKDYKKASLGLFKETFFETKVNKVNKKDSLQEVEFEKKNGEKIIRKYDKILVSIGQEPDLQSLGIDSGFFELSDQGFIKVDNQQKTSRANTYAIGDIAGPPLLAHKASYEGRIASEVIAGKNVINDARAIPSVVYTDPEIATCGLSENEAKDKNIKYKKVKFPWKASGRASAMNEKNGFTSLLIDPDNERILGAGIVGKSAGDMISELVHAIEMGSTAEDIALSIHPHPTLSETIMEAAEVFYGTPTHIKSKK